MSGEQETVADVIASMRGDPSEQLSSWEDTINTRRIVRQFLANYADRIEAAFVRNNDEYNCELTRLREALRVIADCPTLCPGQDKAKAPNYGACYEAVRNAQEILKEANDANA